MCRPQQFTAIPSIDISSNTYFTQTTVRPGGVAKMLSALNSESSFIVLEPVNNSTDYKHLQSYNISADCKSTVRKTSLARGQTLAYHVILLHNVTHYITPHLHPGSGRRDLSVELFTGSVLSNISHRDLFQKFKPVSNSWA